MSGDKAVVLLSGGMDSATAAAWARARWPWVGALSVDYGQRHAFELQAARRVAESLKLSEHRVIKVDLRAFGGFANFHDIGFQPAALTVVFVGHLLGRR